AFSGVTIAMLQSGLYLYAGASGTNTYSATLSPTIAGYVTGMVVYVGITNANTTSSTINLNAFGAKSIVYSNGNALNPGDLAAGKIHGLCYNGVSFELLNPATLTPAVSVQSNSYNYAADTGSANAY